jgi:hypothetical protein
MEIKVGQFRSWETIEEDIFEIEKIDNDRIYYVYVVSTRGDVGSRYDTDIITMYQMSVLNSSYLAMKQFDEDLEELLK